MHRTTLVVLSACLFGAAAVFIYLQHQDYALLPSCFSAVTVFLLLLPYFSLGYKEQRAKFINLFNQHAWLYFLAPIVFVIPYVLYAYGTATYEPTPLFKLLAFMYVPSFLLFAARIGKSQVSFFDIAAIFAIWLPFDMGWISDIWAWPEGEAAYGLNAALGVGFAMLSFGCFRQFSNIGYDFRMSKQDIIIVFTHFLIFFAIALAFGIPSGFIEYNGAINPLKSLAAFVGIFLFIAIPEELLFRGLLQNYLQKILSPPYLALAITAVIFGATHLNNPPLNDWRYFLLATIAGLIYGHAYLRTKNLMAPVILHALVDAVWVGYFM